MYIENKAVHKVFLPIILILTAAIIADPLNTITPMQGLVFIFFVFFIHSNIEKRYIIKQYAMKTESQNKILDGIYSYCPDSISMKDYKFRYLHCNKIFCRNLGLNDKTDIINKTCFDLFTKEVAGKIREIDKQVMESANSITYEIRIIVNEKEKIIQNTAVPITKDHDVIGILTIGRDITKNEHLKKTLHNKHTQLITLLNTLPMVAYLKNTDSDYLTGNFSPSNSYIQKYRIQNRKQIQEDDEKIIREKKSLSYEVRIKTDNDSMQWHRIYKSPIFDKDNNVTGITVLMKNIEDEKNLQSQRETYVATLSHDLKTPTIAQIRALELLLSKDLGEINKEQEEILNLTLDSCKYMFEMVSTLLNTYKYENGEIMLNYDYFNMNELIEACLNEVAQLAGEKNHKIIFKPQAAENIINADKIQVKRILMNLLSNSLTYAYPNTDLTITVEKYNNNLRVCMINRSPYMPPKVLETIFDKYVTHAEKFNKVGAGLGLYLSKQITEAHGGKIITKSFEDNRCIFGFEIPCEKYTSRPAANHELNI